MKQLKWTTNKEQADYIRCHECGSTPLGVPKDYDTEFRQRVLDAVEDDLVCGIITGWVFWPWCIHGSFNAASLRMIADELDRRNDKEVV